MSYIFTEHERQIIGRWLRGEIGLRDRSIHVIVSRVRHFKRLASDVELYLKLREAVSAKPA